MLTIRMIAHHSRQTTTSLPQLANGKTFPAILCKNIVNLNQCSTKFFSSLDNNAAATSFYNKGAIDTAASRASVRLTPLTIIYSSITGHKDRDVVTSAQYLRQELPIRIAKRIKAFRMLPFIVGCNPDILSVHQKYIRTFYQLNDHPVIDSIDDVYKYNELLKTLLDDHKDVVTDLAKGFKDARKHIKDESVVCSFLDQMLTARLSIRLLILHHLRLQDDQTDHIGVINLRTSVGDVALNNANYVRDMTRETYGHAPRVKISGHNKAAFPYIEMPLDYILTEVLKNAARATLEHNTDKAGDELPPIHVIVANNSQDFILKVSDRGGGIPHDRLDRVLSYNFTTVGETQEGGEIFGRMMGELNRTTAAKMHGYGFGLPTAKAYARYLGGSLAIMSMQGLGTDVYLRFKHLDEKTNRIRI